VSPPCSPHSAPRETDVPFPEPTVHLFILAISMNIFMLASVIPRTGHMKLCSVCVLTYDAVVHGKIRERSADVLIRQLFIENNTSDGKTEQ
jgi:hypothetical protein